ncbi:hypothetical protein M9H77_03283 [Catharanthus roseus]|uniref:Uncharacterized protein n=1 Tax=Catharanthus roseus TaxID=4058 RepID=A0ACC0CAV1_CATRO|nr:hypothetical protein M9H77_03283 [Catharanthus roseus]
MKQILRDRFGVENYEDKYKVKQKEISWNLQCVKSLQNKISFHKLKMFDRKGIHYEKKNTCTFVKEETSIEEIVKSVVSTKESEGKRKESEYLIEKHESIKEKQVEEKIQPQFLNFLITICARKSNHEMKVKGEGMDKELSIGFEDT